MELAELLNEPLFWILAISIIGIVASAIGLVYQNRREKRKKEAERLSVEEAEDPEEVNDGLGNEYRKHGTLQQAIDRKILESIQNSTAEITVMVEREPDGNLKIKSMKSKLVKRAQQNPVGRKVEEEKLRRKSA